MAATPGFAVEGLAPGFFLDRNRFGFIPHSEGHTPYVHSLDDLKQGGAWVTQATKVYRAVYDPGKRRSELSDPAVPILDFIASQQQPAAGEN